MDDREKKTKELRENMNKLKDMALDPIHHLCMKVMFCDELFNRIMAWWEVCGDGQEFTNYEFCEIHKEILEEILLMDQLQKEMK